MKRIIRFLLVWNLCILSGSVYAAEDAVNKSDNAMFRDLQSKGILTSERSLGQAVYNHLSIIQDSNASIGDLSKGYYSAGYVKG